MRRRKINDTQLLEMMKANKTQRDATLWFGVSEPAISKRLKRLSPPPESLGKLTLKEQRFALAVVSGKSRTQAAMEAYDVTSRESAKALQKTLSKDPQIREAIGDLLETKGHGREFRVEKLGEHMDHPDPVISLKALDMGFKLAGDEEEAKLRAPEKVSFTKIDLNVSNYVRDARCPGCEHCKSCDVHLGFDAKATT